MYLVPDWLLAVPADCSVRHRARGGDGGDSDGVSCHFLPLSFLSCLSSTAVSSPFSLFSERHMEERDRAKGEEREADRLFFFDCLLFAGGRIFCQIL